MIYDKTMGSIWQESQPKSAYLFLPFLRMQSVTADSRPQVLD